MLRIVTLNLNYYMEKHGPWAARKKLILEHLREKDPHIISFQAVAQHRDAYNGKDQALQLYEELNGFQAHFFAAAQTQADGLKQGNAVIAKFPIHKKSVQKLTLKPGLDDTNQRIVIRTSFERPEARFDLYNAHFSWVHGQAEANIEEAAQYMEKGNANAVLSGDLNTPPVSTAFFRFQQGGLIDAWQKVYGNKEGYTFEADNPFTRIDYFWLSASLSDKINKVEIIAPPAEDTIRLSDHLGLMLELNLKV